uniref:tRNA (Cytidine(34)-2'-O)-methyltransferase (EC) n=1 Tax=uncultured Thiotrichaceae bacterium TaxID=298394 RepID=A0A6S6UMR7_9GAMM|nr:MAG: tRNA (cytidine(34)-2'-O)-methyltransferase (EC [uncultured Thiotrichaceae bacterium]
MGFQLDEKRLRRAGMDYRDMAPVVEHENFAAFSQAMSNKRLFALTTKASTNYVDAEFQDEDILLFGPETRGLPDSLLAVLPDEFKLRIPMLPESRSLNLSNTVSIMAYEALRQHNFNDLR